MWENQISGSRIWKIPPKEELKRKTGGIPVSQRADNNCNCDKKITVLYPLLCWMRGKEILIVWKVYSKAGVAKLLDSPSHFSKCDIFHEPQLNTYLKDMQKKVLHFFAEIICIVLNVNIKN